MRIALLILSLSLPGLTAGAQEPPSGAQSIQSPGGRLSLSFALTAEGEPTYELSLGKTPIVRRSKLGVELKGAVVPSVLNLAEAATLVRCSRAHLCNVINGKVRGIPHLPTVRIGRRVLFRRESLEQWLRELEATGEK